jgi:hypothetical protein
MPAFEAHAAVHHPDHRFFTLSGNLRHRPGNALRYIEFLFPYKTALKAETVSSLLLTVQLRLQDRKEMQENKDHRSLS